MFEHKEWKMKNKWKQHLKTILKTFWTTFKHKLKTNVKQKLKHILKQHLKTKMNQFTHKLKNMWNTFWKQLWKHCLKTFPWKASLKNMYENNSWAFFIFSNTDFHLFFQNSFLLYQNMLQTCFPYVVFIFVSRFVFMCCSKSRFVFFVLFNTWFQHLFPVVLFMFSSNNCFLNCFSEAASVEFGIHDNSFRTMMTLILILVITDVDGTCFNFVQKKECKVLGSLINGVGSSFASLRHRLRQAEKSYWKYHPVFKNNWVGQVDEREKICFLSRQLCLPLRKVLTANVSA